MPKRHLLTAAIAQLLITQAAQAAVIEVDASTDGPVADDGSCTLREAIENANNDSQNGRTMSGECAAGLGADEIQLPAGQTITLLSALPALLGDVSITGNGARLERADTGCNLDGTTDAGEFRLLTAQSYGQTVLLSDFTLANGCADGPVGPDSQGGAVRSDTNALTLQGMRFEDNRARTDGGAVASFAEGSGSLVINNSQFLGNVAGQNGGALRSNSMSPVIQDSLFSGNQASDGGAFHHRYGEPSVSRSTFSGNTATARGGALSFMRHGSSLGQVFTLGDSTLSGNSAGAGGGVFSIGTMSLQNSTLSGNTATQGGGIYLDSSLTGSLVMSDSTLADNTGGSGSQLYWAESSNVSVTRSLISGAAPACNTASTIGSGSNSLATDASCSQVNATVVTPAALQLGPLQNNGGPTETRALGAGSVAIDAGGSDCGGTDQRGSGRPADGDDNGSVLCDAGAFEKGETPTPGPHFVVNAFSDIGDGVCGPNLGQCTLREAVLAANSDPDSSVITFDSAIFSLPQTITLGQGQMAVSTDTTITGPGRDLLTVDADGASRHFEIDDGSTTTLIDVSISDLTLTGGQASGHGGAILGYENLQLNNVSLQGNTAGAGQGGAINLRAGAGDSQARTLQIDSTSVTQNSASSFGGGMRVSLPSGSSVSLTNSSFNQNAGRIDAGGVGIGLDDGVIDIQNCQFSGNVLDGTNVASGGGLGIDSDYTSLTMDQVVVEGNRAGGIGSRGRGGGMHLVQYGGTFSLSNATISGNTVGGTDGGVRYGGGAYLYFGGGMQAQIVDTTFSGNTAVQEGAGLAAKAYGGSTVTFQRTTISGNTSGFIGAGFYGYSYDTGSLLRFEDSTISNNTSDRGGGGMALLADAGVEVINSTITGNRSDNDATNDCGGGGIYIKDSNTGTLSIIGSVVAGNTDGSSSLFSDIDQQSRPLIVTNSLIGDNAGTTLVEAPVGTPDAENNLIGGSSNGVIDPKLRALADNGGFTETHVPMPDSPLIDHYDGCSGDDQRGAPRGVDFDGMAGNDCDIGAVEHLASDDAVFADGFEPPPMLRPFAAKSMQLTREDILSRLPAGSHGRPAVVARAINPGEPAFAVIKARRSASGIELQIQRFDGDDWQIGRWQPLDGDSVELRW